MPDTATLFLLRLHDAERLVDAALHAANGALHEADPLRALDEVALVGDVVGAEGLRIGVLVRLVHGHIIRWEGSTCLQNIFFFYLFDSRSIFCYNASRALRGGCVTALYIINSDLPASR